MRLSRATGPGCAYERREEEGVEVMRGVDFCHGSCCPIMNVDVEKNGKFMKSCACVMLYNQDKD